MTFFSTNFQAADALTSNPKQTDSQHASWTTPTSEILGRNTVIILKKVGVTLRRRSDIANLACIIGHFLVILVLIYHAEFIPVRFEFILLTQFGNETAVWPSRETCISNQRENSSKIGELWHAKMIFIQLTKYHATLKISFNFVKYIMQLSK